MRRWEVFAPTPLTGLPSVAKGDESAREGPLRPQRSGPDLTHQAEGAVTFSMSPSGRSCSKGPFPLLGLCAINAVPSTSVEEQMMPPPFAQRLTGLFPGSRNQELLGVRHECKLTLKPPPSTVHD